MRDCEYELVVLKPEDFEEVAVFLDKHFIPREPTNLGLRVVDIQIREGKMSRNVRDTLCSGVSLGARVKQTGELAGTMLSSIAQRDECEDDVSPELIQIQEHVFTILGMTWGNVDMLGDEQKILDMFILAVAEKHGKKGLATSLVKESIRLGKAAGCNRAAVTITNRYSRSVYEKLEFETVNVLDLTKLGPEYEGPPLDIDNMNGNSTFFSMVKQNLQ